MTTHERKTNELTTEQKRNARLLITLMDQGLQLPPIEKRPDTGPLTPTIDQLCEAYREAGITGFRRAAKTLSVDQPIITELIKPSRYRVISVTDMLNLLDQEWLITNYLYEDAITAIYGPPGCGKSFLALDWACHLALGIDWLGRKVRRCRVFYVATEGVRGYKRRLRAWCHRNNIPPEKLVNALVFIPVDVPLGDGAEVREFIDELSIFLQSQNDGLPTVLILDTLFQCAAGMNINQTDVMTGIVRTVRHIKNELRAEHILLVHHRGKDKERGMSGNMALKAGVDLEYEVDSDSDGNMTLRADKVKDDEETTTPLKRVRVV